MNFTGKPTAEASQPSLPGRAMESGQPSGKAYD